MARRKKEEINELEAEELEVEGLEVDEEDSEEEPTEIADETEESEVEAEPEEEEVKKAKKPRAPRKSRAKKVEVPAEPAVTEESAPIAAAAVVETPTFVNTPAPIVDMSAVEAANKAIVASLEKVNGMLREIPEQYSGALQKVLKQNTPKASPAAKAAFAMSLLATVFSVLSLSFSQAARQAAITHSVALPAAAAVQATVPTPEIAKAPRAPRKLKRK